MERKSIREIILNLLKTKFGEFVVWQKIEADIVAKCAELSEPTTEEKKNHFLKSMSNIKDYLISSGIEEEDLIFIEEEIESHKYTKTMSLYVEEDDSVDSAIIEKYSRLGENTEGVVGIHHPYNYTQLSRLTNGVFKKTGLIKFYISKEKKIYGQITAEISEGRPQKIPIASLIESKKKNKEEEPNYRKILLFGQKPSNREETLIKEINISFYVYRFITEDNQEMILFSSTACEIGDYILEGVMTQCTDYKMLSDSAKLPTKLPFFFAQNVKNRIIKFKNHKELSQKIKELEITKNNLFDFPFTLKKGTQNWKLKQPLWYKWLIWSWLTHETKGLFNSYPMHLMVLGPKQSGKSLLLNSLHEKSKENRPIFSGVSSTMKHLVPSFKHTPAKLGYLAESNRFAFCDEFLRCLVRTKTSNDGSDRDEGVGIMNDLLEHMKRQAGSGVSSVNVNMKSRVLAATNPVKNIHNVSDMTRTLDESFLSRWMIYYQTEDHIQMIRKSNDSELEKYDYELKVNDFISILDYLWTFSAVFDMKKVLKIYHSIPNTLSETLAKHYDARHKHHIECLIDGIIKARCLMEDDMSFEAKEEDYQKLKEVWIKLIGSWMNPEQIRKIELKNRIFYLPENSQYIYWKICELKRSTTKEEVKKIGLSEMNPVDFEEAWVILKEMELVSEINGEINPHYIEKKYEENLNGISS